MSVLCEKYQVEHDTMITNYEQAIRKDMIQRMPNPMKYIIYLTFSSQTTFLYCEPAGPLSMSPTEKTQTIPKVQHENAIILNMKYSNGTDTILRVLPTKSEAASNTAREI